MKLSMVRNKNHDEANCTSLSTDNTKYEIYGVYYRYFLFEETNCTFQKIM